MPLTYQLQKIYKIIFLRSLIKENVCHYLPGDIGGGGIMKKVTNRDIVGRGEFFDNLAFFR